MTIIQIVPRLPPAIDGVGDYALNLARQLRKNYGINTNFVVGDYNWNGGTNIDGFPVSKMTAHSTSELLSLLSEDISTMLLHYVGYGYAKRGCPIWLVEGLERWKSSIANARLVTMFHEISASGSIWTSAFWLSKLQTNLAARLARLSDRILTSKQSYADILSKLSQDKHPQIPALPVFSNIGEPDDILPLGKRTRRLVVFGSKNARLQVYQQCYTALEQTCLALEIKEICDVGVPTGLSLSAINSIPVVEKGVTEAAQISQILSDSVAGFLNFPPPAYLAKSTIFAAFCAHRLIPSMAIYSELPIDGLQSGKHYWSSNHKQGAVCIEQGQLIADNAYAWYQTHNLCSQAHIFATCLEQPIEEAHNS